MFMNKKYLGCPMGIVLAPRNEGARALLVEITKTGMRDLENYVERRIQGREKNMMTEHITLQKKIEVLQSNSIQYIFGRLRSN